MSTARKSLTSSATNELYTPPNIARASTKTLGEIWLDPASNEEANEVIGARAWMTENGLRKRWWETVFLNPPGGVLDAKTFEPTPRDENGRQKMGGTISSVAVWWFKLLDEYRAGHVSSAIFLVFRLDVLQTIQRLNQRHFGGGYEPPHAFPGCIFEKRPKYWPPGTPPKLRGKVGRPTHAGAVYFLPPARGGARVLNAALDRFDRAFSPLGLVVTPRWED